MCVRATARPDEYVDSRDPGIRHLQDVPPAEDTRTDPPSRLTVNPVGCQATRHAGTGTAADFVAFVNHHGGLAGCDARTVEAFVATLAGYAARVQELADLTIRDFRLQPPAMAALTGKGHKTRHVPLMDNPAAILAGYLAEHHLDTPDHDDHPVFFNQHRTKLSRGGIAWIISKYQARTGDPQLANADITPHTLRHYVDRRVMWPVEMAALAGTPRWPVPAT
jgi:integrase